MMTYKNLVFIFGILAVLVLSSCAGGKNLINKQFLKDEYLKSVASNPDHEVQIIYTSVNKRIKHLHHIPTMLTLQNTSIRQVL